MNNRGRKSGKREPPRRPGGRSVVELDALSNYFDREFAADKAVPATKAEKARFERARKRGRPKVGEGARKVNVSIEAELLGRAMKAAEEMGVTRSKLVAMALVAVLPPNRAVKAKQVAKRLRELADDIESGNLSQKPDRRLAALVEAA